MLAVDSRRARKRQTTCCIYSIFQAEQIFAPGVANIAQRKSWRFEPTLIGQYYHSRHQTVTTQPEHRSGLIVRAKRSRVSPLLIPPTSRLC
jgi:hypothetical protein